MVPLCLLALCLLISAPAHWAAPSDQSTSSAHSSPEPTPSKTPLEIFNEHLRQEVHHMYASFDLNHDGLFDHRDFPLFIHDYDTDDNGSIERTEYDQHFDMQEPTLAIVADALFYEFDSDHNGHVDVSDMETLYNRMDLNDDGIAEKQEFEEYMTEVITILVLLHIQGPDFGS